MTHTHKRVKLQKGSRYFWVHDDKELINYFESNGWKVKQTVETIPIHEYRKVK